ncbi:MAG: thioredoxin domain-containing protein [Vicinamibacterales bacterium]
MTARLIGVWILAGLASACGDTPAPPSDAAGRLGDRMITLAEVDAKWQEMNLSEAMRALETVYTGRRTALDAIIGDEIIARAAKAKGLSIEQFLRDEITKRVTPIADGDVEAFYEANKAQAEGQPLAQVRSAIVELLEREHRDDARLALLADLRKDAGASVIALQPPRRPVEVLPGDPTRGPASAAVTIVEFSDYQCPFCARVTPVLARIRATYGDRVRIVWKDFPLEEIHPRALMLASAARCAGEQKKYWEFHDYVFANQDTASTAAVNDLARQSGLDAAALSACVASKRHEHAVADGQFAGHGLGVDSTPTFFINGRRVAGAQPYDVIARVIDDELSRVQRP